MLAHIFNPSTLGEVFTLGVPGQSGLLAEMERGRVGGGMTITSSRGGKKGDRDSRSLPAWVGSGLLKA